MAKYFQHLTFPFEHDYSSIARWDATPNNFGYKTLETEVMGEQFISMMAERGMRCSHVALFYTPPHSLLPIHTDMCHIPHFSKLNFVYGASGSKMFWYRLKPGYIPAPVVTDDQKRYLAPAGTNVSYVSIPSDKCVPVAITTIGKPTLIDAGVPHSVLNNTDDHRWCISIPMRLISDDHIIEFDEAQELLKDLWV